MHVNVSDVIRKPVDEVFDAIVNPLKIVNYFTSAVSGNMKVGEEVLWEFKDADCTETIRVLELEENTNLSFEWTASGQLARVDIHLTVKESNQTKITITEGPFDLSEEQVKRMMGQTHGWVDFMCSLKAWLYTGINLRNGL
tara:strand:+ start:111 stop:533 length:423 start_codon:yes stop_codon:yes gene_type:complete